MLAFPRNIVYIAYVHLIVGLGLAGKSGQENAEIKIGLVVVLATDLDDLNMMSDLSMFAWGAFGSVAIEMVRFNRYVSRPPYVVPPCYHDWKFFVSRVLLSLVAGGVAVADQVQSPVLALQIGAGTPLIFSEFTRNAPRL